MTLEQQYGFEMELGSMIKSGMPTETLVNLLLAHAVIMGVPLGLVAHRMGRELSPDRLNEKLTRGKIDFYRDLTENMEDNVAPPKPGTTVMGAV